MTSVTGNAAINQDWDFERARGRYWVTDPAFGAVDDTSTNVFNAIDAAIDAASNAGGGKVLLPFTNSGIYICNSALTLRQYVGLILGAGVTLRTEADDNLIIVEDDSAYIEGGYLNSTVSTLNNSIVLFHPVNTVNGFDRKRQKTGIYSCQVGRTDGQTRTGARGIEFRAAGDATNQNSYPEFITISDVSIHDVEDGILLDCTENNAADSASGSDELCFINGITGTNIMMDDCVNYFHVTAAGTRTPAIAGNTFTNVQVQADGASEKVLLIDGTNTASISRQMFVNMKVWDWGVAASAEAITIPSNSTEHMFIGLEGLSESAINASFSDNYFATHEVNPRLPQYTNDADLPTASDNQGVLVDLYESGQYEGLAYSNGSIWAMVHGGEHIKTTVDTNKTFLLREMVDGVWYANSTTYTDDDINFATTDVNTTTEAITITGHSLSVDDLVRFSTTGTLPAGLSTGTNYWVESVSSDDITVSATKGGAAVNLTDVGSGTHTMEPCPVFDLSNARIGAKLHVFRYGSNKPIILRQGASKKWRDPFAGTSTSNGQGLIMDSQYCEIIAEALEAGNWAIKFKNGTVNYEA